MKLLAIDFEYNRSQDPDMGLMAVSIAECVDGRMREGHPTSVWLYNNEETKESFCKSLKAWNDFGYTLVAHNAVAEASCFIALGLDPRKFKWLDTYLEYKQLANQNNDWLYGKYVQKDAFGTKIRKSYPSVRRHELIEFDELFGSEREEALAKASARSGDNSKLNCTLENALLNFVPEANYDPSVKRDARRLILECKDEYSEAEKAQILDYANDDTKHLATIIKRQLEAEAKRTGWDAEKTLQAALWRGRYAANVAKYTMHGIPLNMDRLNNLEANAEGVLNEAKEQFNKDCWPIFTYSKTGKEWKMSRNTQKTNEMIEYLVKEKGLKWKKTKDGNYSTSTADGEPLQAYEDIHPWLKQFVRVRNLESVLKGYKQPDLSVNKLDRKPVFRDNVGKDGRLRPWYGPFGTQTGRNAPGAKAFVFAQAAVMRALVDPPPGRVIHECLAEGTKVLTKSRGLVNIEDVRISDRIWDGVEYVKHRGVIVKGKERKVIKHEGIYATSDHRFMGEFNDWHSHSERKTYKRYQIPIEAMSWRQVGSMAVSIGVAYWRKGLEKIRNVIRRD